MSQEKYMFIRQLLPLLIEERVGIRVTGMSTGFKSLDELTSGLHTGLAIVASRPCMGKTAMAIDMASHIAINRSRKVSYFTYNESMTRIVSRFLFQRAGIPFWTIGEAIKEEDRDNIESAKQSLDEAAIRIFTGSALNLKEICGEVRAFHGRDGQGLVVIDDIQSLVKANMRTHDPSTKEFSSTLAKLEKLAEEAGVTILLLSCLPSSVEKRAGARPIFKDMEKSGLLRLHANLVIFLYREGLYDPYIRDPDGVECIVGKNSNGSVGTVLLGFDPNAGRFLDRSEE